VCTLRSAEIEARVTPFEHVEHGSTITSEGEIAGNIGESRNHESRNDEYTETPDVGSL